MAGSKTAAEGPARCPVEGLGGDRHPPKPTAKGPAEGQRQPKSTTKGPSENQHQMAIIKWSQQASIRQKWPELKLLFHIPNERKCTPQQGRMLKLMGVKRGVPDLCLPVPRGRYCGLFLEIKTETGRSSDDQDWWGEQLMGQGYAWEVCHGWESAVRVLEWYLSLPAGDSHG